jgi:hypothetical protein
MADENKQKISKTDVFRVIGTMLVVGVVIAAGVLIFAGVCQIINPALRNIAEAFYTVTNIGRNIGLDDGVLGLGYLAILLIAIVGIAKMYFRR